MWSADAQWCHILHLPSAALVLRDPAKSRQRAKRISRFCHAPGVPPRLGVTKQVVDEGGVQSPKQPFQRRPEAWFRRGTLVLAHSIQRQKLFKVHTPELRPHHRMAVGVFHIA